jgi:hypothetical protein
MRCDVLYCIVLYCIVLYCTVLYCIVLYCIVVSIASITITLPPVGHGEFIVVVVVVLTEKIIRVLVVFRIGNLLVTNPARIIVVIVIAGIGRHIVVVVVVIVVPAVGNVVLVAEILSTISVHIEIVVVIVYKTCMVDARAINIPGVGKIPQVVPDGRGEFVPLLYAVGLVPGPVLGDLRCPLWQFV